MTHLRVEQPELQLATRLKINDINQNEAFGCAKRCSQGEVLIARDWFAGPSLLHLHNLRHHPPSLLHHLRRHLTHATHARILTLAPSLAHARARTHARTRPPTHPLTRSLTRSHALTLSSHSRSTTRCNSPSRSIHSHNSRSVVLAVAPAVLAVLRRRHRTFGRQ